MKPTEELEDLLGGTVDWVLAKLNNGDGLSYLVNVQCEEGQSSTIYIRDTAEEALALLREDLASYYKDVRRYVAAFDGGWIDNAGNEHRGIITDCEERESGFRKRLAFELISHEGGRLALIGSVIEFRPPDWSLFAPKSDGAD